MVGKKFNVSEIRLKELYEEVKTKTSNFKIFEPSIISENSQRVIVFRLALGKSVERFAELCERTHGSIENLEKSPKQLNYKVGSHYMNVIKNNLHGKSFQHEKLLETLRNFRDRAMRGVSVMNEKEILKFAKLGAKESLKKRSENEEEYFKASLEGVRRQRLTNQETKIKELLEENKIPYKVHEFVSGENLDFVIENGDKSFLIACSSCKIENLTHHARRLMYQAYRVKYKSKNNLAFIGILGGENNLLKMSEIPRGATKLLDEICDAWFIDENLSELTHFIKTGSRVLALQNRQTVDQ